MTMVSRQPCKIVACEVNSSIQAQIIQKMVDRSPHSKNDYTDGGMSYLYVIILGKT